MFTKIVGSMDAHESRSPVEFAGSLKRCLTILAREAREAGFTDTANSLLAQEDVVHNELQKLGTLNTTNSIS